MATDDQIIETLEARNYDCNAVSKLLKIHVRKVEKVYKRYMYLKSHDTVKKVAQKISRKAKEPKGLIPKEKTKIKTEREPAEIEKDFIDKSYKIKMAALEKIENLVNTETDPSRLAQVIRILDTITSKQDPPDPDNKQNQFFNIKRNENKDSVKRLG